MSSFGRPLSLRPSRTPRQQHQQLSPPHAYKSGNSMFSQPLVTMDVTSNSSHPPPHHHSYRTPDRAGSSMDDLCTPPTPPLLALSNSSHPHMQQQHSSMQPLPSLPSILEPPFAPSSGARYAASTAPAPAPMTPYSASTTASMTNSVLTATPFTSSTSVDSTSSSPSSPRYHCRWRHCLRHFHGPELLYQHLCDDHVGRHARGNLCLECRWEDCQTVTNKRDHITSHLRVHVPLTPLRCRICDKRYKRRQDLKKHERKHAERLELSSAQLSGSELPLIVHPLPGTVLPDTHPRHNTTGGTPTQHNPYSSPHSYPPSASSSATSLRSGSPVYRSMTASAIAPPSLSSTLYSHHMPPHHNHHSSHQRQQSVPLPPPSHNHASHYSHHHPILPALTPSTSTSPSSSSSSSSSFAMTLTGGIRGGSFSSPSLVSQPTTTYPPQSNYTYSQPPTSSYQYSYSSQPMSSNAPSAPASLPNRQHLPLPNSHSIGSYHSSQPTSMNN